MTTSMSLDGYALLRRSHEDRCGLTYRRVPQMKADPVPGSVNPFHFNVC